MSKKRIFIKNINADAIKNLNSKNFEGESIGLADGKVVVHNPSIKIVMDSLFKDYKNKKIAVVNIPKKNKIFVL